MDYWLHLNVVSLLAAAAFGVQVLMFASLFRGLQIL